MKKNFGAYIRQLRQAEGYTLTQLGAMLGIDSGALSKIENSKKSLDISCIPKLAEVFHLDLNELKEEFLSEKIAYDILSNSCNDTVLKLAEEKVKYIRNLNYTQSELNL